MKAIDLFSGAGGFSLSACNLGGIEILAAIELDNIAAETYRKNIIDRLENKTKLLQKDIIKITPSELRKELKLDKGELSLILGGPPCQGFSTHRINNSGVKDPRNTLLLRYFDFVAEFRPKAFLIENVSGLLWKRHSDYLNEFKKLATRNNYKLIYCDVLNAKDYGVPQNRKRTFILGIDSNLDYNNEITFPPEKTHFNPNSKEVKKLKKKAWVPAASAFEKPNNEIINRYIKEYFNNQKNFHHSVAYSKLVSLPFEEKPITSDDPCNIHMRPTPRMEERFIATPLNGSRTDAGSEFELKCHSNGYQGHMDVYGRIMIHQPANTITTGCNNPSKGRFVHPWKNHGITLRHAARLQTFPDDFIFLGNSTQQARQIGNAVPPKLGEILLSTISEYIRQQEDEILLRNQA